VTDVFIDNVSLYELVETNIEHTEHLPETYRLYSNYPNPFNPLTRIKFALPEPEHVELIIYNIIGQKIVTPIKKTMNAGEHEIDFNADNLSSGIYYYKLHAGEFQDVKKMVLLK